MQSLSQRFNKALVTGAGSGLGRAFSDMLLQQGVEVLGTSRNPEKLEARDGFRPLRLDLTDGASLAALFEELRGEADTIDLLVNNAGEGLFGPFELFEPDAIGNQLRVMLHGPIALCHYFYPRMRQRNRGTLVNVASLTAQFPMPFFSIYNSAKAGLSQFSRSLRLEAVGSRVRVIDFQPGDYQTDFNANTHIPDWMPDALEKLWQRMESLMARAPSPQRAADDLYRALRLDRAGLIRSGGFFQCRLAPLLARFASRDVTDLAIKAYYRL